MVAFDGRNFVSYRIMDSSPASRIGGKSRTTSVLLTARCEYAIANENENARHSKHRPAIAMDIQPTYRHHNTDKYKTDACCEDVLPDGNR